MRISCISIKYISFGVCNIAQYLYYLFYSGFCSFIKDANNYVLLSPLFMVLSQSYSYFSTPVIPPGLPLAVKPL